MKYLIIVFALIAAALFGGYLLSSKKTITIAPAQGNNVTVENDKQIVEIRAKGGYQPRNSIAKAGIPTTLRLTTKGTFDCSSSVRIPSMNIEQLLPASGSIDIDLGVQQAGVLHGTCGMGMYPFSINFN
jgi:plastocyanin domain-containing protein